MPYEQAFSMPSTLFQDCSPDTTLCNFQHFPVWPQSPHPHSPPEDARREGMTSACCSPGLRSPPCCLCQSPLLKLFNCFVSQRSWQALCRRKTRCLKLAAVVIVGSSSKPNRGIRQCKESPGVLTQPHICEEYVMPETAVSLTRLRWREAC